jgi:archaemetzincin
MEAYFHPMTVKVAPALGVAKNGPVKSRMSGGNLQWNCVDVLNHLQRRVPREAYIVMAATMSDLYPSEEWNFVFGMARIKNRVGTFSFARYGKDPTIALKFDPAVRHHLPPSSMITK